jgi:hypothetical protein
MTTAGLIVRAAMRTPKPIAISLAEIAAACVERREVGRLVRALASVLAEVGEPPRARVRRTRESAGDEKME